jgi:hypothetical protein
MHEPAHGRDGATESCSACTDGGYALYAVQGTWQDGLPSGVVHVRELRRRGPAGPAPACGATCSTST